MKYADFQDFLIWQFAKEEPGFLDDDIPDAFDAWLENLGADEWIDFGDRYAKLVLEGKNVK